MKSWFVALTLLLLCATSGYAWVRGGSGAAMVAPTIISISLSNSTFVAGTAGTVGTISVTLSSGPFTGALSLQTTGTDHAGTTCNNYGSDFAISGSSLNNTTTPTTGSYPGVCVVAMQGTATNSPYVQAFTLTGGTTGPEIGSGFTLVNNGSTATNVPVREGYGYARGDMPLGNTVVCKDETGAVYACQIDELSTRTALPHASDTPGWLHSTISLIYTPSWTNGANHTFHVYRQSGTYSPGTGLPTSALTAAHDYQILYNNVKDFNNNVIGSGNFTCDSNNAITAGGAAPGTIAGVGGGVASGGGGYVITENGAVETTIEVLTPAVDNSSHVAQGQVMCRFFIMMWQSSPGSGILGNIEIAAWIGQPWQNTGGGTHIGFMWGDAELYDATTSTVLRNFSVQSNYAPSDFFPDPQTWPASVNSANLIYGGECGNYSCGGNGWGTGGNGFLTASGTSVTNTNGAYFPTSNLSGTEYIYVGPNTGCTAGAYQITGSITNGVTLASAPCGGGGTIADWQMLSGFVNNNGNLQTGTVIQFSATGGGTLPTGISATRPYFVGELATSGTNAPGAFAISNISTMNQWPDLNGFYSQGSCTSGSCIVATRKVALQPWEGTWLFADDSGHPFWVAGASAANIAQTYPTLSNAQKTYFESTALIPPYWLGGPASAPSPFPLPGDTSHGAAGPYYESLSSGPQETNIDGGSTHMSLGNMGGLEANAFMNMTQANWDLVHTHALTMASAYGHYVLNTATGWYTPYDCGPYPNGNLASCGTYGSPIGAAGAHTADFLLWINPNNSAQQNNFTAPATYTGFLAAASPNQFDSGIFWSGGTDGSNTSMSHEPDYGNAMAYIIGGEPWYLRGVQGWGTFAAISQWNQGNSVKSNTFTINGYTYSEAVLIANGTETPRGNAWSFRSFMYPAVLGADSDPGRRLFWNYAIESVDEAYAVIHQFYGQNINGCSGCSADPNIETLGIIDPLEYTQASFMTSYYAGVTAQFYPLTHYVSDVLSGSSALWLANEAGTLSKQAWYDMPLTTDPDGHTVCTFWAAAESFMERTNQYAGAPEVPGQLPAGTSAAGIWVAGDGTIAWRNAHMDASGVITPSGYNQAEQGLVQNGDAIIPDYVATYNAALGSGKYWAVNVVSNSGTASFQLTLTAPSTQACSAATGSTGCPAPISPPTGVPFTVDLAWRPQGCQAATVGAADGGGVDGYSAEDWAQFNMGIDYGLTLPHISNALANLTIRWNMPTFSPSSFQGNWQSWYMGAVTVP